MPGRERAARDLRARDLIVAPGEAAGRVKEPMIERVADAPAHCSRMQHHVGEARRAGKRRCRGRSAGERIGKRGVGLDAKEQPRRQHEVVAALKAGEEAPGSLEYVEPVVEIERAA